MSDKDDQSDKDAAPDTSGAQTADAEPTPTGPGRSGVIPNPDEPPAEGGGE